MTRSLCFWCASLSLTLVPVASAQTTVVAWGDNNYGQATVPPGLTNVVAVTGGPFHSLALRSDGTVAAWGDNRDGQTAVPPGLANVAALAAGYDHSVALLSNGTVVCWGLDYCGQATPPTGLSNVVAIAADFAHTLALKNDGTVVGWGWNGFGQYTPPAGVTDLVAIATGERHSVGIRRDGTLTAWGDNQSDQLRVAAFTSPYSPANNPPTLFTPAQAISARWFHTVALLGDPAPEDNWAVDCCLASLNQYTDVTNSPGGPGVTGVPSRIVAISAGAMSGLALHRNGAVVAWGTFGGTNLPPGLIAVGAIGAGWNHALAVKTLPEILAQSGSVTVNPGSNITFSVSARGALPLHYQWHFNGADLTGATNASLTLANTQPTQAGLYCVTITNQYSSTDSTNLLLTVVTPPVITGGQPVSTVVNSGASATFSVTATGSTPPGSGSLSYQWQFNGTNLPGGTDQTLILAQCATNQAGTYRVIVSNALGSATSLPATLAVLATPAYVVAWGSDWYGESDVPPGLVNVRAVAAGSMHSLTLKMDGTVVAWGQNDSGQSDVPVGLSNVVGIAAGQSYSLALRSDGTVVGWGGDYEGMPMAPGMGGNVLAIAAGWWHALLLNKDGTVWAIGNQYSCPEALAVPPGLTGVREVAAGLCFSLALKSDGTVVGWGRNDHGQATPPPGLAGVVAIAAGDYTAAHK